MKYLVCNIEIHRSQYVGSELIACAVAEKLGLPNPERRGYHYIQEVYTRAHGFSPTALRPQPMASGWFAIRCSRTFLQFSQPYIGGWAWTAAENLIAVPTWWLGEVDHYSDSPGHAYVWFFRPSRKGGRWEAVDADSEYVRELIDAESVLEALR